MPQRVSIRASPIYNLIITNSPIIKESGAWGLATMGLRRRAKGSKGRREVPDLVRPPTFRSSVF